METNKAFRPSDIKLILKTVYQRKWLLIIPWIVVSGLAVAGSYLIPPQFKASIIISVDSQINLSPEMRQRFGNMNNNSWGVNYAERLRSYYNEITSAVYLSQLDQRLGLSKTPAMQQAINTAQTNMPGISREQATIHILQSSLKDRIEIQFAGEDQLQISISSLTAAEASDLVNGLGEIFIEEKHLQRMNLSRLHGDFSDTQLEKFERKLQDAVTAKTQFESYLIENRLSVSVISITNQNNISTEIYNVDQEVERYRQREQQLLGQLSDKEDRRVATPRLEESNQIKNLSRSWRDELASISELILTHPWNSSPIRSLKNRLNRSLTDIEEENSRLTDVQYSDQLDETKNLLTLLFNSRENLKFYRARAAAMETALEELTARINRISEDQAQLDQLNQDIVSSTLSRDRWKREQETSAISQDLFKDFRYRVIEPARPPLVPFKPNRIQIGLFGIMLGLIIGGAAVVMVELMDNSFKKVEEIPEELGLPVLGIAPKMPFLKKVGS